MEGGSVLAFPVPGESPEARVLMQRIGEAILLRILQMAATVNQPRIDPLDNAIGSDQ